MINPYCCYVISFGFALLVYALGWSSLYPKLSASLILFIVVTCLLHAIAGRWWTRHHQVSYRSIRPLYNPLVVTGLIYLLWIIEFIYQGIPLVKLLLHQPFNYRLFGVPSLHVFLVTFSSFYTLHLFRCYLNDRSRLILILYPVNLFAAILIYSRAMLFFNLTGSLFLWLFTAPRLSWRWLIGFSFAVIFLFYFFGVLGTIRDSAESHVRYDPSLFLDTGGATSEFRSSLVPKEFFWSYIYISSPLANLQTNLNSHIPQINTHQFLEMANNEWVPDALSKRIDHFEGWKRPDEATIPGPFNVSTVYSRSYSYLGWLGIMLTAALVLVVPVAYKWLLDLHSHFELEGMAILCTLFLFLVYDNTLRFTGLSFQLFYPLFCGWIQDHRSRSKKG